MIEIWCKLFLNISAWINNVIWNLKCTFRYQVLCLQRWKLFKCHQKLFSFQTVPWPLNWLNFLGHPNNMIDTISMMILSFYVWGFLMWIIFHVSLGHHNDDTSWYYGSGSKFRTIEYRWDYRFGPMGSMGESLKVLVRILCGKLMEHSLVAQVSIN